MSYSHRYYTDAERLKAVKALWMLMFQLQYMQKQIGVNPRTLRDLVRAFKSFNGGFINITKEANDPNTLATDYRIEMRVNKSSQVEGIFGIIKQDM